ncbi:MAG: DUF2807 domain-containing protein [Sinomicrobium sp.]|nr:DUF2807 domain-containing protein [Sinomicrobium sp.]
MKKISFIILLLCSAIPALAQEEITRQISDFSEIKVFDGISAELVRSEENKIVVSGDEASQVEVIHKNGKLKIRMKAELVFNGHKTFVKVYHTGMVDIIDANENAYITASEPLKQIDLELRAQEGGEIDLNVDVQRLNVKSVTGGKIEAKGSAKNQDVNVNTGGQYEADGLLTEQTTVNVNAGGRAYINASEYVEAKVRAGGTIRIYGDPKVIDKQTFLGGRIIEQQ